MENTTEQNPAVVEKTPEQIAAEKEAKKAQKEAAAAANKAAKDAKKAERMAKREAQQANAVNKADDPCADKYGDMEIIRSQCNPEDRFTKVYVQVKDIDESYVGKEVRIRARLHNSRGKGKICFAVLRESYATIQLVLSVSDTVSKGMVTYAQKIPKESIVEVIAQVTKPAEPIEGCSQQVELQVVEFWGVNKSVPSLPFQLEDASRRCEDQTAELGGQKQKESSEESKTDEPKMAIVNQDTRLNNRIIDLRVTTNQAIFRLQSGVCQIYREFLLSKDFVEIHTPKMIGGMSEGGANVFRFKYFDRDACLAQSPQLYKQMAVCGDLTRVFEIGPVFRAENSNTNRHLCEFTGLDMEMEFKNHYFEVLDLIGELMVFLFKNMKTRYARELSVINDQYPFEEFKCCDPVFKLNFREGCKLLREAGYEQDEHDDLSTETEKALGRIVREKFDTDFYMLYGYPIAARPFYTMLDPHDPRFTNSYDFFMRGEEITSGAQRIHDPALLAERAAEKGIPVETIKDYIDAFKYGAPAHGGAGFGLERIVKFYCNLHNIRKSSMFPRDPARLAP